jgi:hypothetical protein
MAESKQQHVFSYKEIVEALIKQKNLHEGVWSIYVEFSLGAANINGPEGKVMPAAIIPVTKIGLQRGEKVSEISVDAAEVNPEIASPMMPRDPRERKVYLPDEEGAAEANPAEKKG